MLPIFAGHTITVEYEHLSATNKYNLDASIVEYEIIAGVGVGQKGAVECQWREVSKNVFLISWQETSGATVVHFDDFNKGTSVTYFTTSDNLFYQLEGELRII